LGRLAANAAQPMQRVGLSATQKPIEEIAKFLVGEGVPGKGCRGSPHGAQAELELRGEPRQPFPGTAATIVNSGHIRERDLNLVMPVAPLEAVMSGDVWATVYDQLARLIDEHHTTLVFANTRRMVERVSRHLAERLGETNVAAHHGSLSKETRFDAEQRLKAGKLKVMVATASLELGIDIGDVELVCQ